MMVMSFLFRRCQELMPKTCNLWFRIQKKKRTKLLIDHFKEQAKEKQTW